MPRQNRGIERLKTEVNRSSPDAYAAIIGIPISALVSLSLVLPLEQVGGPIVFKMPRVEFKGASG
ncbi:hypothetical protein V757_02435 [Pelistega indica]|uniref:Uncharacterized protein n=1 Tax=Pelistega indica TaxID=1414851 RepID=V8G876_9BURK|nr:hypothetical protein V757_02435 [Pelistega indica]